MSFLKRHCYLRFLFFMQRTMWSKPPQLFIITLTFFDFPIRSNIHLIPFYLRKLTNSTIVHVVSINLPWSFAFFTLISKGPVYRYVLQPDTLKYLGVLVRFFECPIEPVLIIQIILQLVIQFLCVLDLLFCEKRRRLFDDLLAKDSTIELIVEVCWPEWEAYPTWEYD